MRNLDIVPTLQILSFALRGDEKYSKALEYLARTYARLAAVLEEEYIFNWLAWDGDNMLADGGILDYGSIRQFAARHNKYRYEDVDRASRLVLASRKFGQETLFRPSRRP